MHERIVRKSIQALVMPSDYEDLKSLSKAWGMSLSAYASMVLKAHLKTIDTIVEHDRFASDKTDKTEEDVELPL